MTHRVAIEPAHAEPQYRWACTCGAVGHWRHADILDVRAAGNSHVRDVHDRDLLLQEPSEVETDADGIFRPHEPGVPEAVPSVEEFRRAAQGILDAGRCPGGSYVVGDPIPIPQSDIKLTDAEFPTTRQRCPSCDQWLRCRHCDDQGEEQSESGEIELEIPNEKAMSFVDALAAAVRNIGSPSLPARQRDALNRLVKVGADVSTSLDALVFWAACGGTPELLVEMAQLHARGELRAGRELR